jgi:hypothetical protein
MVFPNHPIGCFPETLSLIFSSDTRNLASLGAGSRDSQTTTCSAGGARRLAFSGSIGPGRPAKDVSCVGCCPFSAFDGFPSILAGNSGFMVFYPAGTGFPAPEKGRQYILRDGGQRR